MELGLTIHQYHHRLSVGRWEPAGRAVARISGTPRTWEQDTMAACLSRPGAVGSLLTAVALAGLGPPPGIPHITVPHGQSPRTTGTIVHRARLHPIDRTVLSGVPCTTIERTLVDCAKVLGPNRLGKLVASAVHELHVRPTAVDRAWERAQYAPGRWGETKLTDALEPWRGSITPDSPAEDRLRQRLDQWGYPPPTLQIKVVDDDGVVIGRIDLGWPERMIGLEYEGARAHGPDRWAADNARHRNVTNRGWVLLYVDKADLMPGEHRFRMDLERAWSRGR